MKKWIVTLALTLASVAAVAQTNQGPFNTPQINSTYYVGSLTGGVAQFYPTIQTAVTAACAAGTHNVVDIPPAYTGSDPISGVTGGCTTTSIRDEHNGFPNACYTWQTSVYSSSGIACAGGGASPGGSVGAMQYYLTSSTLGGLNGTGIPYLNGSSAPTVATSAQIVAALNTSPGSTTLSNLLLPLPQVYGSTPFLGFSATNGGSNIAGITITSNPTSFTFGNGTPGDLTGSIVAKTINTTDLVVGSNGLLSLIAAYPAGPNNNYPSAAANWSAQIYNGTENAADEFDAQNVVGTGTNPTATLAFTHLDGGTTGAVTYRFDNNVLVNAGVTADTATISNLIGDDGCLESVGGVVTSTGAACGSGSGEVSSVFGRAGAVVAATGDYTAAQVTDAAATNVANTFTAAQTISPSSGDAGLNLIPTGGTEYGMFASATGDSPGYWYIVDNTEQRANFGMHSYNTYGDQVIFSNTSGLCWTGTYDIRGASCVTGFFQAGAASLDLGTGASGSADGTLNLAIVAATTHITTPSIAGTGTATYTLGTSAVVGTGATIATTTGHVSDGMSGEVHLVTGTGITATTGTMFTVTLPITRTNDANCVFSPSTGGGNFMSGPSTTSTFTIGTNAELIASTNYYFDYWCGGN